jgi:hypothetical protein
MDAWRENQNITRPQAARSPQSIWEAEMSETYENKQEDMSDTASPPKLMTSGVVRLEGASPYLVEIQRGMTIHSRDGLPVGKVSAVIRTLSSQQATGILLDRLPEVQGYWHLPAAWISEVDGQSLWLSVSASAVESLPAWHMPSL